MDFERLCPEVCERVDQHCDTNLKECLTDFFDSSYYLQCTTKDDSRCYTPELIPPSGEFEFDLCFFGDPSRCKSTGTNSLLLSPPSRSSQGFADCEVKLYTGVLPSFLENVEYGEYSEGPGTGYAAGQSGPACCPRNFLDSNVVTFFEVVNAPSGEGLSCEDAVSFFFTSNYAEFDPYIDNYWICTSLWFSLPWLHNLPHPSIDIGADANGQLSDKPKKGSICTYITAFDPNGGESAQFDGCKTSADNDNCPGVGIEPCLRYLGGIKHPRLTATGLLC